MLNRIAVISSCVKLGTLSKGALVPNTLYQTLLLEPGPPKSISDASISLI